MKKGLLMLVATIIVSTMITGCNLGYRRGYDDGLRDAPEKVLETSRAQGYREGYKKGFTEGFEKAYPGSPNVISKSYKSIYKMWAWGGLTLIILTLTFVNLKVIFSGDTGPIIIGKLIYTGLGAGAVVFVSAITPGFDRIANLFLTKIPKNALILSFIAIISILFGYFFVYFMVKFVLAKHSRFLLGWCAFLISAILTVLIPLTIVLFTRVPDISLYNSSVIFSGTLVGGLYYIGDSLLRNRNELYKLLSLIFSI